MNAHSHVRFQSRKPLSPDIEVTQKKQGYLFRARSFIAKHGVLLVNYEGI